MKKILIALGVLTFMFGPALRGDCGENGPSRKTPISTTKAKSRHVLVTEESVGKITTRIAPAIAAEAAGMIQEVFVDVGQAVQVGDPLVRIDSKAQRLEEDASRAEVERLNALIANQARTVQRYRNLVTKKSIPQSRLDDADAGLATLREQRDAAIARLSNSRRRREKTDCRSPIAGWIEKRFVSVGDYVHVGTPLFQTTTVEKLRVILPFPESVAYKFKKGQSVNLTAPLAPDRTVVGEITEIQPSVNVSSQAVDVIVDLDNPGSWMPGGSINGAVIVDENPQAVVVPDRSVVRRPVGDVVYVVEHRIAKQRNITVGQRIGEMLEIVDGLQAGVVIAADGAGYLSDGAPVRIQETEQ